MDAFYTREIKSENDLISVPEVVA